MLWRGGKFWGAAEAPQILEGRFGSQVLGGPEEALRLLVPKFARRGPGPPDTPRKTSPAFSGACPGPVLFPRRTPPHTCLCTPACRKAGERAGSGPSMSRSLSAAHHRSWAAYAMSLGFGVYGSGLGFGV